MDKLTADKLFIEALTNKPYSLIGKTFYAVRNGNQAHWGIITGISKLPHGTFIYSAADQGVFRPEDIKSFI